MLLHVLFVLAALQSSIDKYLLHFIHSAVDRYLGGLQFRATVNGAALHRVRMSLGEHVYSSCWVHIQEENCLVTGWHVQL